MEIIIDLLEKQYEKENYLVVHNNSRNGLAYIYCSSNALYEKDNPKSFMENVVENDRYEWLNLKADCKPELEIFIRDIWLSWYVKGINSRINSYEKLIGLMKNLTQGYKVRCVGASSGGFIGNILAMELSAEISYSFAPQFSLSHHFEHLQKNPYLREYCKNNDDKFIEYYKRLNNAHTTILYMYPNQSEQDQEQYNIVKNKKQICIIEVDSKEHGVAIFPFAVPIFISYNKMEAEKMVRGGF